MKAVITLKGMPQILYNLAGLALSDFSLIICSHSSVEKILLTTQSQGQNLLSNVLHCRVHWSITKGKLYPF